MKLYCLRHTSIEEAYGALCYGQKEVPLKEALFEKELAKLQTYLPSHFDALLYSPLERCARLAERLPARQKMAIPALKELSFGEWEGVPWNEIPEEALQAWMQDYVHRQPPGGESYKQLCERLRTAIDYTLELEQETVAWVTHAGCMRALLHLLVNIPLPITFFTNLQTPALAVFEYKDGYWFLDCWNPPV